MSKSEVSRLSLSTRIRDLSQRSRKESELNFDCSDYDFVYSDCDTLENELAELYSYSEAADIEACQDAFEDLQGGVDLTWEGNKKLLLSEIVELCEQNDVVQCKLGVQCVLYLLQGFYNSAKSLEECLERSKENAATLYEAGLLHTLMRVLVREATQYEEERRQAEYMEESLMPRLALSAVYTMMCLICSQPETELAERFRKDIASPILGYPNLGIFALELIYQFEKGLSIIPIKKVALLYWKFLLYTLGSLEDLARRKAQIRAENGLPEWKEPKDSAPGQSHVLQPRYPERMMDEEEYEFPEYMEAIRRLPWRPKARQADIEMYLRACRQKHLGIQLAGDTETTVGLPHSIQEGYKILRSHLYRNTADLAMEHHEKMLGTPMRKRKALYYHPAAEQVFRSMLPKMEDYIISLLKVLLASASNPGNPLNKARANGSLNILSDVLPEHNNTNEPKKDLQRHKEIVTKAVSGSLLLLLKHLRVNHILQFEFVCQYMFYANCIPLVLKFLNQDMNMYVTADNSVPMADFPICLFYVPEPQASRVISEDGEEASIGPVCWRNMFSTINMLRILQKFTKWRSPRIIMLNVFKSPPILKKTLKVSHWMVQLYVLKLFKGQARYMGKNWRKANMRIMSAIYQHVRHRLLDDWAYGSDLDTRQWETTHEEQHLKQTLQNYMGMWYKDLCSETIPYPPRHLDDEHLTDNVDEFIASVPVEMPRDFSENWREWVQREVIDTQHDWDALLERFDRQVELG